VTPKSPTPFPRGHAERHLLSHEGQKRASTASDRRETANCTESCDPEKGRRLLTCTPRCTQTRHSGTCRQRASRQRARSALREQPDQNLPAYLSDELGLSEEEKVGVELIAKTPIKDQAGNVTGYLGAASMEDLLLCIELNGHADGIIESAWALPLWQFRKVEEAWRAAPKAKVRRG
jgi:hypothetical protein